MHAGTQIRVTCKAYLFQVDRVAQVDRIGDQFHSDAAQTNANISQTLIIMFPK